MRYRLTIRAKLIVSSEIEVGGPSGTPEASRFWSSLVMAMGKNPGARPGKEDDLVGFPGRQKVDVATSCAPVCDLPPDRSSEMEVEVPSGTPEASRFCGSLVADMAKHPGTQLGDEDDLVGVPGRQKVDKPASCVPVQDVPHCKSSENIPDRPGTPDAMKLRRSLVANMAKHPCA